MSDNLKAAGDEIAADWQADLAQPDAAHGFLRTEGFLRAHVTLIERSERSTETVMRPSITVHGSTV